MKLIINNRIWLKIEHQEPRLHAQKVNVYSIEILIKNLIIYEIEKNSLTVDVTILDLEREKLLNFEVNPDEYLNNSKEQALNSLQAESNANSIPANNNTPRIIRYQNCFGGTYYRFNN